MRQFIKDNKPYSQTDRTDLIEHYLSIGCEEVDVLYNNEFIDPIWNGSGFVESATQEEINASKKSTYLEKLIKLVNYLDNRILVSSVNKEESDIDYLKNQTNRYTEKYKVAKKYVELLGVWTDNDNYWYNAILSELSETNQIQGYNMSTMNFMQLIVMYYEGGEFRKIRFDTALERFRAKTKDFILVYNWVKADACMSLAESLPNAMSLQELDAKLVELENI